MGGEGLDSTQCGEIGKKKKNKQMIRGENMKTKFIFSALTCIASCLFATGSARAELPLIRLDRIFPLGGQAGSEVQLEIGGKDFEDVKALHFDHPGLKATFVKPNQFKVAIAADVPSGTYEVRAVGK